MHRHGATVQRIIISTSFMAVILVSAFGGRALATRIERDITGAVERGIAALEGQLAQQISWESLDPSILTGLTLSGVRVSDNATASRVAIDLRLGEALWGDPTRVVTAIRILDPVIVLDSPEHYERLATTIEAARSMGTAPFTGRIVVRRGSLFVRDITSNTTVEVTDLTADAAIESNVLARLSVAAALGARVPDNRHAETVSTDIRLDLEDIGGRFSATVETGTLVTPSLSLSAQTLRVEELPDGTIRAERIRSADPLEIAAAWQRDTGELAVTMESEAFLARELATLSGEWAVYNDWLDDPVTASLRATFDTAAGGFAFRSAEGTVAATVDAPQLPAPVAGSLAFTMNPQRISVSRLDVRGTTGSARFVGDYRFDAVGPSGRLALRSFSWAGSPVVTGDVEIVGTGGFVGMSIPALNVGDVDIYNMVARWEPGAGQYDTVTAAFAFDTDGSERVRASARIADLADLTAQVELIDVPIARVAATSAIVGYRLAAPSQSETFRANGAVRIDIRDGVVAARVPWLSVTDPADATRLATLVGSYRDGTIQLDQFFVRSGDVRISGDALVRIATGGTIDFSAATTVNGLAYSIRGLYSPESGLIARGPYGLDLRVARAPGGGLSVTATIQDAPLPVGQATLSADLDGLYRSRDDWILSLSEIDVENLPSISGTAAASARLAVAVTPTTLDIAVVEVSDAVSPLAGTFTAEYSLGTDTAIQLNGTLRSFDEDEEYRLSARATTDQLAVDLRFVSAPLRRFTPRIASGTVNGTLQIAGEITEPQFRLYADTTPFRFDEQDAELELFAYLDRERVEINGASAQWGATRVDAPSLSVDRGSGAIEGELAFLRPERDQRYGIAIRGETIPLPELTRAALVAAPITVTADVTTNVAESVMAGRYLLDRTTTQTDVTREDGAVQGTISEDGAFRLSLAEPLPIVAQAQGRIGDGEIEATISDIDVDLTTIGAALPTDIIEILDGRVTGALRVIGSSEDPDFFGTLALEEVALRTRFSPDTIGPLTSAVILEEKGLRLLEAETRAGAAPVLVSAEAALTRREISAFRLALLLPAEEGVRIDDTFGPIAVDGFARGSLEIAGTPGSISIAGDVTAYNASVSISPDTTASDTDEADRINLTINLGIATGRSVQFLWPDANFPVLRSNFATGQSVRITGDFGEEQFDLVGSLAIQSGDVFYFDRSFLIRNGRIEFQENQDSFDPRLTARAELREVTPEGPVRIFLVAEGQRLSEFSPRFESNPPLPGTEIVAILGGNIFRQGEQQTVDISTAILSTSDIVTQFGVFREFENNVREQLDLDLFAIRTSVIQNLLLTAINPATAAEQQVLPSLGTYLNDTSIFMGRYLGDAVFGQLLFQMRAREFENDAEDPGIQRLGGVLIDSEISLEWQTPFFLLEWNLAPQNPEELFIRDNTFTFSWSFSY